MIMKLYAQAISYPWQSFHREPFALFLQLFTLSVPFTTETKIQQYELLLYQVVMLVMLVMSQKLIQKICPISNQMKKVIVT